MCRDILHGKRAVAVFTPSYKFSNFQISNDTLTNVIVDDDEKRPESKSFRVRTEMVNQRASVTLLAPVVIRE